MKHYNISKLDETGLVRTIYTTVENAVWHYGVEGYQDNYHALAETMEILPDDMVRINQIHSADYELVTSDMRGRYVTYDSEKAGDAMITNEPGLLLCTLQADCTPVYFLDPVHKAIAMIHSGWRGTAAKISVRVLSGMTEHFDTDPADLLVGIGPCICGECYEVGGELKTEFLKKYSPDQVEMFFLPEAGAEGKYMLDVKQALRLSLLDAGVQENHVFDSGRCTYSDPELCSYRRQGTGAGRMLTGILLR